MSATMIAAHQAGISVFVTGGVGGVHRDGENSKQIGILVEKPYLLHTLAG